MARFLATAILLSSGMAPVCLDNDGPDPGQQIFESSLAQWNEEGPTSYDMVLRRQTIGANPTSKWSSSVRNDVVTSRIYFGTTSPSSAEAPRRLSPTSPACLRLWQEAMAATRSCSRPRTTRSTAYPSSVQPGRDRGHQTDNVTYTVEELTRCRPVGEGHFPYIKRYLGPLPPSRGVQRGPSTSVALQSTQFGGFTTRVPSAERS